jgi:hypothetical protein
MTHSFCHQKKKVWCREKKPENVNEDTIGNEIVTSDQLVNAIQCTFPMQNLDVLNLYLFCKKSNRRLEFNDTGFFFNLSV